MKRRSFIKRLFGAAAVVGSGVSIAEPKLVSTDGLTRVKLGVLKPGGFGGIITQGSVPRLLQEGINDVEKRIRLDMEIEYADAFNKAFT